MMRWGLAAVFVLAGLAGLARAQESPPDLTGTVRDASGAPVASLKVTLELGRGRFSLTPEYDRWLAVDTRTIHTDEEGRFKFRDVPAGALGTAWAKTDQAFGVSTGSRELAVTLRPLGGVRGTATGKKSRLRGLRVYATGGEGFGGERGELDDAGRFQILGLPPGEAVVSLMFNNWVVAEQTVTVKSGVAAPLRPFQVGDGYAPQADPLVDVREARLIDPRGKPVAGVQLIWSSPWMDGGMNSDERGEVKLVGGGVAIGLPPFLLRLRHLRGEPGQFWGKLRGTQGGKAVVELRPLRAMSGTVTRAGAAVTQYLCAGVTAEKPAQVYWGGVEAGRFTVHLPEGKAKLVFGLLDGTQHEHALDVPAGEGTLDHAVALDG